jgi:DNA-binding transcriptional MocR family regulator
MNTIWEPDLSAFPGPKYQAVAGAIEAGIASGDLRVGQKLPPVRDLAWTLKITPGTVARAYTILTDQGILEAAVGRGTFVADPNINHRATQWEQQTEPRETDGVSLFSPKLPDVGQVAAIREALVKVSERAGHDLLNYPSRQGYQPAREAILKWLQDTPIGPATHQDVVLCHGGQNGISLVMQAVLKGQHPVVLVEELSYAGFRRAAELLRAEIVGVPSDEYGVIPEALDELARKHQAQLFCTSPEVHNPTGQFTPFGRRKDLAAVAQKRGFDVLEDDCYRMGPSKAATYRALLPGQGWYVSSISKTLTPSLRVGFAVAPRERASDLRRVAEYGFFGLAKPLADLVEVILSDPRTPDLSEAVRERMATYIRSAVNILGRYDIAWQEDVPFIWLKLPAGWRATAFCRAAEMAGIQIRSAEEFALRDARVPHAVRIAVNAHVSLGSFERAVVKLRQLLDNPSETIGV